MSDNIFSTVEEIKEFMAISELLEDPEVDEALKMVMTLIRKPDAPNPKAASEAVVKLQALSAKFQIMAVFYTTIGYTKSKAERDRKNIYYSLRESLDKLADAVKYLAKT